MTNVKKAISIVKRIKDAMDVYTITWLDQVKKSKGYPRDEWRFISEIKASSLKEALDKLAKLSFGIGTANVLVVSISKHDNTKHVTTSYMYTGTLFELLRKNLKDEDILSEVKDEEEESTSSLDTLITDEEEAIKNYKKAIAGTTNPALLAILTHILEEEADHVKELREAQAGNYEN